MNPSPDNEGRALGPGEAYRRCVAEMRKAYPDPARAQLYATLSVEETLRGRGGAAGRRGRADQAGIPPLTCGYTTVRYRLGTGNSLTRTCQL